MLNKLRERAQGESGFTLIELLVVMLIIGLLAAIAIPSFFNQRDKARDADAKEQVRTAQTAMETFATDNGGSYNTANVAALETIEATLPASLEVAGPTGAGTAATAAGYTVTVPSATGIRYSIRKNGTAVTYPCSVPTDATNRGGCPANNVWNAATN